MITLSAEEYKKKYGEANYKSFDKLGNGLTLPKQSFLRDAVSDLNQVGTDIRSSFNRRMDNNLISSQANQGVGSKTFQELGSGFGFAGDVAGSVIKGVTKAVLPQGGEDAVKNTISSVATPIVNSRPVQSLMERYNALAPEVKRNLDSTLNIGSLLTEAFGVGAGAKVARTGVEVGLRGLREGGEQVAQGASRVANTVKDSTSGIVDFVRPTIDAVRNAPSNVKTNIEASKVYQESVNKLPQTAQNAVKKGVDIEDLTKTLSVNKAQKPSLGKLYTGVKNFVSGKSKLEPIDALGKPVVTRFNILKNQTKGLGTQLDEVAEGLKGKVVKGRQSVVDTVDETLAKIGISKTDEGLDFVGSNLEGLGADEKIIGNIYRRIQESTDANDLHRLKKYIDNNVNFGKTSGGFTGEAESLIKGWRKTIDGRLDLEFPDYNKVNTELAKRLKPINDFKKHMKSATGLDEDLMNMSAGQLMRRIASNVRSNPEIRQVLRDLDNATKVKGKVSGNIEALVDFYATLEKYYPEIVGKNTLQGQFKNALETSGGIVDKVTGAVKSVAGQSEAVKRKAITDFFDDFFNTGSFNKGAVPTTAPSVKVTPKKPFDRTRQGGFTANPFAQKPIKIGKSEKPVPPKPKVNESVSLPNSSTQLSAKDAVAKGLTEEQFVKGQVNAYHGTPGKEFSEFKMDIGANTQNETRGLGVWVTNQQGAAKKFSNKIERGMFGYGASLKNVGGTTMSVSTRLKNPKVYTSTKGMESILDDIAKLEKDMPSATSVSPSFNSDVVERRILQDKRDALKLKIKELKKEYRRDAFENFMDDRDQFATYIKKGAKWEEKYISLEVPKTNKSFIEYLKKQGHDGIIIKGTEYDAKGSGADVIDQIVAFNPKDVLTTSQLRTEYQTALKGKKK